MCLEQAIDQTDLQIAIVETCLVLRRHPNLHPGKAQIDNGLMDYPTFQRFVRDFGVARTIRGGESGNVLNYLNKKYDKEWFNEPENIPLIADKIRQRGWTPNPGGNRRSCISLVSKFGFFADPNIIIPVDNYSRSALRNRLPHGRKKSRTESYNAYLKTFNEFYNIHQETIQQALNTDFAYQVCELLLGDGRIRDEPWFGRKVADTVLVIEGAE